MEDGPDLEDRGGSSDFKTSLSLARTGLPTSFLWKLCDGSMTGATVDWQVGLTGFEVATGARLERLLN